MKKRALSLLMSLVMLVSMLPTTAWAADETETTTPEETTKSVDFTATVGDDETPLRYTVTKDGYKNYFSEPTVDLYTVQIPVGTTQVDLIYQDEYLTYSYSGYINNDGVVIGTEHLGSWGVSNDGKTGSMTVTMPVDCVSSSGEADGMIDYIQVQKPYNADWSGGELQYAITFKYVDMPFTATYDGSPLNVTALNAEGYAHYSGKGPLYTVTVPRDAESVELSFPENYILYNYDGKGNWLYSYSDVSEYNVYLYDIASGPQFTTADLLKTLGVDEAAFLEAVRRAAV